MKIGIPGFTFHVSQGDGHCTHGEIELADGLYFRVRAYHERFVTAFNLEVMDEIAEEVSRLGELRDWIDSECERTRFLARILFGCQPKLVDVRTRWKAVEVSGGMRYR